MANEVNCIKCGAEIQPAEVQRPSYVVKATNKKITPLPKCAECRAAWEAAATGVEKVQN